jgi:hypothetical protein
VIVPNGGGLFKNDSQGLLKKSLSDNDITTKYLDHYHTNTLEI